MWVFFCGKNPLYFEDICDKIMLCKKNKGRNTMAKQIKKKTAVKSAPVMEHKCGTDCPCGCHKHAAGHRIKHIIVLLLVFILGYACGKMVCCGKHRMPHMPQMQHPVFTNGCLDMQSVQSQKMQEILMSADANGDNCISIEEYKAFKAAKAQKYGKKGRFGGMMHGKIKPQPQQD